MNSEYKNLITEQPIQMTSPSLYPQLSTNANHSQTIFVNNAVTFGPSPILMNCPSCNASIRTGVSNSATCKTCLWCLCLSCFCPFGCCLIPCCMDSCQAQEHKCPNCKNVIGVYNN